MCEGERLRELIRQGYTEEDYWKDVKDGIIPDIKPDSKRYKEIIKEELKNEL